MLVYNGIYGGGGGGSGGVGERWKVWVGYVDGDEGRVSLMLMVR